MRTLANGSKLIEAVSELPRLLFVKELFLDVETKAVYDGLYPFKGDVICGFSFTINDDPDAYYIPLRHTGVGKEANLPIEPVIAWVKELILTCQCWINHRVPFDAVFMHFEGVDFKQFQGKVVDTNTLAKCHDSDRFSHELKPLCREWLGMPMGEETRIKNYLKGIKSKSYSDVPPDLMGEYGCMDVIGVRALYRFLQKQRPDQVAGIWDTEIKLQSGLIDMELRGLATDRNELRVEKMRGMGKIIKWSEDLARVTEREFTNSNQCKYDILINRLGLPVLATKWEKDPETGRKYDTGRPSFDKHAMALYEVHPQVVASKKNTFIVKTMKALATECQYQGLFVESFLELMDHEGFIHPTYNPVVRTGRMACKRPNAQQQNKRSKKLIKARKGRGLISCDYSQIEYRLIAHYCNDLDLINAYVNNPDMDFHQWVADMIGVSRKAGKTLNFGMAYGAGKKRVEEELAGNPDIIQDVSEQIAQMINEGKVQATNSNALFKQLCREKAARVYQAYHEKFPAIKRVSKEAENACKRRGYIFNAYGRRRHIPYSFCSKAFNSLVQGCAMDLIKERMVSLFPRYNQKMRDWDIHIVANVHDEILFDVPEHLLMDPEVHDYITSMLESPSIKFRVPIKVGLGVSRKHWAEAAGDECTLADGQVIDRSKAKLPEGAVIVAGKIR